MSTIDIYLYGFIIKLDDTEYKPDLSAGLCTAVVRLGPGGNMSQFRPPLGIDMGRYILPM